MTVVGLPYCSVVCARYSPLSEMDVHVSNCYRDVMFRATSNMMAS